MAVLVATAPAAAQSSSGLDIDSPKTPAPELTGPMEKRVQNMSHSSNALDYQDDSGNWQTLNGTLQNVSNPISFSPVKISDSEFSTWPSEGNSSLDASAFSTTAANADLSLTNPSGDVDTLKVNTSGLASGETATATFSDVAITDDAAKHNAWVAVHVQELSGSATVVFSESDGDEKRLHLNSSLSRSSADVLADDTGVFVTQQKLGDLATDGSGDGTFSAIDSIEIVATDGNVDLEFTTLTADHLSKVSYGSEAVDSDGDGTLENVSVYEPTGTVSIASLDSLPSKFDDARIYDLEFAFHQGAAHADVKYEFSEDRAEDYQYQYAFDVFYEFSVPDVMDLDLQSDAKITGHVAFPTERLLTAEYMEGAPSTASYEDLRDSTAWTSLAQSYEAAGDNATVTVDDSVQQGNRYVLHQVWLTNQDDRDAMTESGGVGVPFGGAGGTVVSWLFGLPGMVVSAVAGYGVLFRNWLGKAWSMLAGYVG